MKSTKEKIEVCSEEYKSVHGKAPKGKGSWAFIMHRDGSFLRDPFFATPHLTFTEAKQEAIRFARQVGATFITVGP